MLPRTTDTLHDYQLAFAPLGQIAASVGMDSLPEGFPRWLWNEQSYRYLRYWQWWKGEPLDEPGGTLKDGTVVPRFPLRINPLRDLAEKHASYLLGSPADLPGPIVRTLVSARPMLGTRERRSEDEALAKRCEDIITEVWEQSNGKALQAEQAMVKQWAGGEVYQIAYEPGRTDLRVPVTLRAIVPDYFLPIWSNGNYWDLLECWVVYYISAAVAREQYGVNTDTSNPKVLYVENWKKNSYSIWVDNKPVKDPTGRIYLNYKNPFGFVPFTYIPHLRAGGYYGLSHVDDIEGLTKEINARMSDEGLAIKLNIAPKRTGANITTTPQEVEVVPGYRYIDLGMATSATNYREPRMEREDPPNIPEGMADFPERLFDWLQRMGKLTNISYGEDEGSQRSGETMLMRLLPSIQHATVERMYTTEGYNDIAMKVLGILAVQGKGETAIPKDFRRRVQFTQDWPPFVARDRSALATEMNIRTGGKPFTSQRTAIEMMGDIRNNPDEELKQIFEEERRLLEIQAEQMVQMNVQGEGNAGITNNPKPAPKVSTSR